MKIATLISTIVALINGQSRIYGGSEAAVGKHRYVTQLIECDEDGNKCYDLCGGSLIAPNAVLTAAHCILKLWMPTTRSLKWVVVGSHFRTPDINTAHDGVRVEIAKAVAHPQFRFQGGGLVNDVAILFLEQNITDIQPVQVSFNNVGPDVWTWARGWGYTEGGTPSMSLLEVQLQTWSDSSALAVFNSLEGFKDSYDRSTNLAAGGVQNKDTCWGDSGCPLTIERTNSPAQLVGITSWGHSCGSQGIPGAYSEIRAFEGFIKSYCSATKPCKDCAFTSCSD